jgi:acetolactate synthase-1/2/3 large subunit
LTVIFNNAKWATVVSATSEMYPDIDTSALPLTSLGPHPNFEKVIEAFGGYGLRVSHPSDLPAALKRALFEVKENNRQALLNIIC